MRADLAVRHNAAVGALVGLAVGDVLSQMENPPSVICGGVIELPDWGATAAAAFEAAERRLQREPLDMGIGPTEVVGAAIALADPDASPPLLGDPDAVLVCGLVRSGLLGRLELNADLATGSNTRTAIGIVSSGPTFAASLLSASPHERPLVGALAGVRWGPGAIPASWSTGLSGPVGGRRYGLRQLRRLSERLLGEDAPVPPEPRRSIGPREVAPKLWLSNLHAVSRFIEDHPDGAVISLCPTTGRFDTHRIRREFALHDAPGSKVNPHLSATVDEILSTIAAFHAEGRDVLVHCHHGASRTGLVLRAWLVRELGLAVDDATVEAQVRWSKTSTWNNAFSAEIRRRAGRETETIDRS